MIGAELLQLLQGDPLAQMRSQMAGPNPNPQAPPPPAVNQPPVQRMSPAPASIGGPPGHFEILPDQAQSPHWVPGPAKGPIGPAPPPLSGVHPVVGGQTLPGTVTPATPAEQRGAQVGPMPPQGGPPAPGGAPQPPPALPQSGPPSVASQSPPDLASLYMRLMQQQRSGQAIDHGLALMASAYAAPGTQGQIMHSMDNQQQDPSAMMGNLIQLQQMQNMTNARPAMIAALGGGDASSGGSGGGTGIPPAVLNGMTNDQLVKLMDQRAQSGLQIQQKDTEDKHAGILRSEQFADRSQQDDGRYGYPHRHHQKHARR